MRLLWIRQYHALELLVGARCLAATGNCLAPALPAGSRL
jgi:hypothetical protein